MMTSRGYDPEEIDMIPCDECRELFYPEDLEDGICSGCADALDEMYDGED